MIKIIDDVVTKTYAESLYNDALSVITYNYSSKTIDYDLVNDSKVSVVTKDTYDTGQFSSVVFLQNERTANSWYFNAIKPMIYTIIDKCPELNFGKVIRVKYNLLCQNKTAPEFHYNIPHQDSANDCYSIVYYCNDSDGDTFLFNEYCDGNKPESLSVYQRVSPVKNRAVIFDSNRYHAGSYPRMSDNRVVLNILIEKL
jgi:hypothetical protein